MSKQKSTYLGDSVYAEFDGCLIELYTHDGITKSEPIYLQRSTYDALRAYGARLWELAP